MHAAFQWAKEADVLLKLGDEMLPAHRDLLTGSSDYFRAMFQASSASQGCSCIVSCGVQCGRTFRLQIDLCRLIVARPIR